MCVLWGGLRLIFEERGRLEGQVYIGYIAFLPIVCLSCDGDSFAILHAYSYFIGRLIVQ